MKFSPKCRIEQLEMIYTLLGSFCYFLNWERADVQPQIRPRQISGHELSCGAAVVKWINTSLVSRGPKFDPWLLQPVG